MISVWPLLYSISLASVPSSKKSVFIVMFFLFIFYDKLSINIIYCNSVPFQIQTIISLYQFTFIEKIHSIKIKSFNYDYSFSKFCHLATSPVYLGQTTKLLFLSKSIPNQVFSRMIKRYECFFSV